MPSSQRTAGDDTGEKTGKRDIIGLQIRAIQTSTMESRSNGGSGEMGANEKLAKSTELNVFLAAQNLEASKKEHVAVNDK